VETTHLDVETANILDVGCGTGHVVNMFAQKGAIVKGVDKSPAMIQHQPLLQCFTNGEAEDPTLYERGAFTHILCLYMTIYEMKNKTTFFRNAFYGLQPNGYLVVHLHNNDNNDNNDNNAGNGYNGFIHLGKPKALDEKTITDSGIKRQEVDFGGFTYKRDWSDSYMLKETFTDRDTHSIRQNELHWYYEPISTIVEQCKSCGFRVYSHIPASPSVGGWLYFFVRPGGMRK
jgi:SAM-dependent methyltransferase